MDSFLCLRDDFIMTTIRKSRRYGSEVAAFPATPDAGLKMVMTINYHAGVVMLHKGSYSFFFPCEGPLPGWYGGRIQRNLRFRGMGSQRERRSFWHTTFLESLVCYTFVLMTMAGRCRPAAPLLLSAFCRERLPSLLFMTG